jgi:hypothetical protein
MEIVKKAKGKFTFKVLRPFQRFEERVLPGAEVELSQEESDELTFQRKVEPVIDSVGVYIALKGFNLPGRVEKYTCKSGDRVALKKADAISLLLDGSVIPCDSTRWRPLGRRLRKGDEASSAKKLSDERTEHDAAESYKKKTEFLKTKK